ncbi:Hypothetical predicted protein [Podarcis lilfordi]|uniref:Uncharacterized protein n=1 Tax=Podarcis lilfordi TaxID=74358 RepID=A0AA35KE74_9SAUR|nr:Hypothetical predicted protein [Podarcis lilfordi]
MFSLPTEQIALNVGLGWEKALKRHWLQLGGKIASAPSLGSRSLGRNVQWLSLTLEVQGLCVTPPILVWHACCPNNFFHVWGTCMPWSFSFSSQLLIVKYTQDC